MTRGPRSQRTGYTRGPTAAAFQQVVDVVVWATPIVSFDAMRQAFFRDAQARYGDIVFWSQPADWKLQIATPNASSRYVYVNFNTAEGAVVLEVPPAIGAGLFGSVLDAWQVPVVDIGPHGEDEGRGGKFLLLPPGDHATEVPGGIPIHLATFNGYAALRAIPESSSPAAINRALGLVRKLRVYPANRIERPPEQRLIDMSGKLFDGIVRYDDTLFRSLARMIEEEPVHSRDAATADELALLGIEKGKRFRPTAAMRELLDSAARSVRDSYVRAAARDGTLYWPGSHWRWPSSIGARTSFTFLTDDGIDTTERGLVYFMACAPPVRLGKATAYLSAFVDAQGKRLEGERTYGLHVPAGVPAHQFWAATVYDTTTASFVREAPRVEISSFADSLQRNDDGSFDLYFGPEPPATKRDNWVYTAPETPWFAMFRLYGPDHGLFDKTWRLPDLVQV